MSYTKPSISGYNASPPSDDASETSANTVRWSNHITKIGDPLKSYLDAVNNATESAWNDLASTATVADGAALVWYKPQNGGSFLTGATGTTVQAVLDKQWLNVLAFDATIDTTGATNDTTKIQAAIDYLESVGGGILYFPRGTYKFAGLTCNKIISFIGEGSAVTIFQNATDAATMLAYTYSGIADKDKRNVIQINDIQWLDTATETGRAITTSSVFFVQFNRCYWRNFITNPAVEMDETLWVEFNFCNTDRAEIKIESVLDPHFTNLIRFQSGEYRNPETYAIRIIKGDIVIFDGVTVEGDSSNTTSPTRGLSIESADEVRIDGMYMEFLRTSDSGMKLTSCKNVQISKSLLGTGSYSVPAVWLNGCTNALVDRNSFTSYGFKADGGNTNVIVEHCSMEGDVTVADGDDVVFRNIYPIGPTIVPINPAFQSVMQMREGTTGISLKNVYTSSSLKADPSGSITGAATAAHVTNDGYLDEYCLSLAFTGAQQAVFPAMGTTDGANHGAIITFMAKADIDTTFVFTGSISSAVGGATTNITTDWRRYFLFTSLSSAGSGSSIGLIIDSTETSTLYIDDIQTVSYSSLANAAKAFSNFRHIRTFGAAKSAAAKDPAKENFISLDAGDDAVTIATGVVYASGSSLVVDTESAAASDDLDTINGVPEGCMVFVRASSSARTVVLKDGTGNLSLSGDITLDNATDVACLIKLGGFLREFSQANNGA